MKNILVLLTGGTIACGETEAGLVPVNGESFFAEKLNTLDLKCRFTVKEIMRIDSSDMGFEQWNEIGRAVYENAAIYDGIIICHGTDTMAYTSSALSFVVQGVGIPVVITGSQRPLEEENSDGRANIIAAAEMAKSGVPGIFAAFDGKIIRGTNCVKTHTLSDAAFESINCEYAAQYFGGKLILSEGCKAEEKRELKFYPMTPSKIMVIKLVPDMETDILDYALKMRYNGVIIEGFGLGGINFKYTDIVEKIRALTESGIPVVMCSQCLYEKCDFSVYEGGRLALEAGAVDSGNMTKETVYAKLKYLISLGYGIKEINNCFNSDIITVI